MLKKPPAVIPALDVSVEEAVELVRKLSSAEDMIAAYKISSLHALESGLRETVAKLREVTQLPIIYDHQKGCTDIPKIAEKQVKLAAECGVNSFIAVPLGAGGETLIAFVNACKDAKVIPIVLLEMTQPGAGDYLKENAPELVFEKAKELGVEYFVAPGNKPEKTKELKAKMSEGMFITSPGIGVQGGKCEEAVKAGTDYPIVGRAIYQAEDPVAVVKELYEQAKRGFEGR